MSSEGTKKLVRAIRGATVLEKDDSQEMKTVVSELLKAMLTENQLDNSDLISIVFTATQDLTSDFPAVAARDLGLGEIPLLCAVEIAVPNSLAKVVRVLMHAYSERSHAQISHVYLRGAQVLRKDLAQ
jgi:chorismate mutase